MQHLPSIYYLFSLYILVESNFGIGISTPADPPGVCVVGTGVVAGQPHRGFWLRSCSTFNMVGIDHTMPVSSSYCKIHEHIRAGSGRILYDVN